MPVKRLVREKCPRCGAVVAAELPGGGVRVLGHRCPDPVPGPPAPPKSYRPGEAVLVRDPLPQEGLPVPEPDAPPAGPDPDSVAKALFARMHHYFKGGVWMGWWLAPDRWDELGDREKVLYRELAADARDAVLRGLPSPAGRPALYQAGDFTLASGRRSSYKVECDAMTPADWDGVAAAAREEGVLPDEFGAVLGVPRGGVPFAAALQKYAVPGGRTLLVAEDVVTTGGSMERYLREIKEYAAKFDRVLGVCFKARGPVPDWVRPVWRGPKA